MSDTSEDLIDYTRTSWVQDLKKPQLKGILSQLKVEFDEEAGIDELQKILRAHIAETNRQRSEDKDKLLSINDKPEINHAIAENTNISQLEFHLGKDDWETYTERLELYFVANDIKTEKQAAVLLTKISPDTYKLVRDLCAPAKPSTKTFKELVKLINDHLNPKPSETMERCKFHQATHQQKQ